MTCRKPRLTLAEYRLLCEMRAAFQPWRCRHLTPDMVRWHAACDHMDGRYKAHDPEVRGLVRKRILRQFSTYDPSSRDPFGEPWPEEKSWYLTDLGARLVAPEAFASAQSAGGKARAAKLAPERRAEIARKAATARWSRRSATPTPESPDA